MGTVCLSACFSVCLCACLSVSKISRKLLNVINEINTEDTASSKEKHVKFSKRSRLLFMINRTLSCIFAGKMELQP